LKQATEREHGCCKEAVGEVRKVERRRREHCKTDMREQQVKKMKRFQVETRPERRRNPWRLRQTLPMVGRKRRTLPPSAIGPGW
jgi:hypothetical protein